jgi:hypothetical protein
MEISRFMLDADIPCGRAKNIEKLSNTRFRFLMPADGGYLGYWCIQLKADITGMCTISIPWDPDYTGPYIDGVPRSYKHRMGCGIFIHRGSTWIRVPADGIMHEPEGMAAEWSLKELTLSVKADKGETVFLSNTVPWPYAQACEDLHTLCTEADNRFRIGSIGKSGQARDIIGIYINEDRKLPGILVVSGEHATEFAGQHTAFGMVRFLASGKPEAEKIMNNFRFLMIPQVNPDGNTKALMHHNALGADICGSYSDEILAGSDKTPECRAVFEAADRLSPVLVINIHGGSWIFGNPPHHFTLRPNPENHVSQEGRERQEAVDYAIINKTQGVSSIGKLQDSSGKCLHAMRAVAWEAAGICYEPEIGAGAEECLKTGETVLKACADSIMTVYA